LLFYDYFGGSAYSSAQELNYSMVDVEGEEMWEFKMKCEKDSVGM
jgi:hypothetical protein